MTIKSIRKISIRKKKRKAKAPMDLSTAVTAGRKYSREVDLKEKYRTSKEDLEHLFV